MITPGIYGMLISCLAMLVDGDWCVRIMKIARVIITKGKIKVATLIHIWVDCLGHLEKPLLAHGNPGVPV